VGIPNQPGIYLIYVCRYDKSNDTVTLLKLVYIGEADKVRDCIQNHEMSTEWTKEASYGSELCFSFAPITHRADRRRAEAALLFKHKPACNIEYREYFSFDETTVNSEGQCALLVPSFTVSKTEPK